MLDVNVSNAKSPTEWDSFVKRVPNATVYHLWEWGEILSIIYGYERHHLIAARRGEIIGAFPIVHVRSKFFGNRLISSPFCEYGGPITDPTLSDQEASEALKFLLNTANGLARELNSEYVEIREVPSQATEDLMTNLGYIKFPRYVTFEVDLTRDLDEIWARLHKDRTRKSIKKAVKSNVVTKDVETIEQLATYYALYLKTTKRLGSPPHKYDLFRELYETFKSKGEAKILLAHYNGVPIGGITAFCHGTTIFDWNSVSDSKYRNLNAHNLLLWNIIEWGVANGYQILNLGRTRKGTPIYDFKSGWGGLEKNLSNYIHFLDHKKNEPADTMQRKYRYLSRAWSLMPSSIAKRIGPRIIGGIAL